MPGSECVVAIRKGYLVTDPLSGRIGQSVLQTGEGIPKGTAKWTKRNHLAAVKVNPTH